MKKILLFLFIASITILLFCLRQFYKLEHEMKHYRDKMSLEYGIDIEKYYRKYADQNYGYLYYSYPDNNSLSKELTKEYVNSELAKKRSLYLYRKYTELHDLCWMHALRDYKSFINQNRNKNIYYYYPYFKRWYIAEVKKEKITRVDREYDIINIPLSLTPIEEGKEYMIDLNNQIWERKKY